MKKQPISSEETGSAKIQLKSKQSMRKDMILQVMEIIINT